MTARREIKQRSAAVWARVQTAYLAGEPAASVAARFDVGLGNLRFRANKEGWTRKAVMASAEAEDDAEAIRLAGAFMPIPSAPTAPLSEAQCVSDPVDPEAARQAAIQRAAALLAADRPLAAMAILKAAETLGRVMNQSDAVSDKPTDGRLFEASSFVSGGEDAFAIYDPAFEPDQALERVTRHAAQLLSEGRAVEAQGLIRAAEGLRRLTQRAPRPGEPEPMTIEEEDLQAAAAHAELAERVNAVVEHLVHEVLSQHPEGVAGMYEAFVYRFRAQHFGPGIEAGDHAHAVARGWSLAFWDEEGRLLPDIAVGPSGHAPFSTEPPHGHDPRDAHVCCHWAEWLQTELREGRAGNWRMGSGGEAEERG